MENISLIKAGINDKEKVCGFSCRLSKEEHFKLKRVDKITKAISGEDCFLILANNQIVGFVIFDYRFFDLGWIELIIIDEEYRGRGIGAKTLEIICAKCKAKKVFTSTNSSNVRMQKALKKAGFRFSGKLIGLDDGDPELFYHRQIY